MCCGLGNLSYTKSGPLISNEELLFYPSPKNSVLNLKLDSEKALV